MRTCAGVDDGVGRIKSKAALMGHTSYEMTMHYQREAFENLRRIVDAIA